MDSNVPEVVPDEMTRDFYGRDNPYCMKCGDERGGHCGHEMSECTFRRNPAADRPK